MKFYSYKKETGEFCGIGDADKCQLSKKETWLLPSGATFKQPPDVNEDQAACFSEEDNEWHVLEDFRGRSIWDIEGRLGVINELGPVPDGWSLEKPHAVLLKEVMAKRRALYCSEVDPLINEALIKRHSGETDEADNLMALAVERRAAIQLGNPKP